MLRYVLDSASGTQDSEWPSSWWIIEEQCGGGLLIRLGAMFLESDSSAHIDSLARYVPSFQVNCNAIMFLLRKPKA